ncbi:SPOR domain-containing protein [Methyloligella sp. 2.7D]|uniref:SPOR domain-containing protein n=1 Tax=unclassified Methyloligella TaxID=2625955 RepID=UPI00157CFF89|nr:SPOR domain-containing protein [Methyloligella sp. GL2]QKP77667.1 SPOR domain-containing protein [Methyloligella sp. GL2]
MNDAPMKTLQSTPRRQGLKRLFLAPVLAAVFAVLAAAPAFATDPAVSGAVVDINQGNYSGATQRLSSALNKNEISSRDAAEILFYRGIAYRKMGRAAQAISDLGAAIWLGLPSSQRVEAQVYRGFAYQALGLQKEADIEFGYAKKAAPSQASRLIKDGGTIGQLTAQAPTAASGSWLNRFGVGGGSATPELIPGKPAGPSPPKPAATSGMSAETRAVLTQEAPPPATEPEPKGNRFTRWFGSWGGTSAEPPEQDEVASTGGTYNIQLAPRKSNSEAMALWRQVQSNPNLAGKTPSVKKADLGNLGTFYRLQVGPFASKAESDAACNSLKRSGIDCFLVSSE